VDVDLPSPLLTSRGSTQRLSYQSRYLRVTFGQSDSPDDLLLDSTTYLLVLQRPVQRLDRSTCVCSTGAPAVSRRLTWFPAPRNEPYLPKQEADLWHISGRQPRNCTGIHVISSLCGASDDVPQLKPCVLTYFFFLLNFTCTGVGPHAANRPYRLAVGRWSHGCGGCGGCGATAPAARVHAARPRNRAPQMLQRCTPNAVSC
jgi:hypothetical protein